LGTRSAITNPTNPARFSYLTGGLDEVAIYPRVLGVDEIMDNYNTGISPGAFRQFTSTPPRRVLPVKVPPRKQPGP